MTSRGGFGGDRITIRGDGNDRLRTDADDGDDVIRIEGGSGTDTITYDVSAGVDTADVDGGSGVDTLTINRGTQSLTVQDEYGVVIYQYGSGGTVITVVSIEHGIVLDQNGIIVHEWYS